MEIKEITDEEVESFDNLNMDAMENIERQNCQAVAAFAEEVEEPLSTLIWEYHGLEEGGNAAAELLWFDVKEAEAAEKVLDQYDRIINEKNVTVSELEFGEAEADENLRKLLADNGFSISEKEGRRVLLNVSDLSDLVLANKKPPEYILSIEDLSAREFKQIILKCLWNHHKGVYEDIINIPMYWFDTRVSCCLRTDNRVSGVFLVHCTPSGALFPVLLFAEGADAKMNILNMIRYAVCHAMEEFPPNTRIILMRNTEATAKVVEKMFPNKKGEKVIYGKRTESTGE